MNGEILIMPYMFGVTFCGLVTKLQRVDASLYPALILFSRLGILASVGNWNLRALYVLQINTIKLKKLPFWGLLG